jgi:histidinol-phosphate aminotransferase
MKVPRYRWQPTTAEIAAAAGIPQSLVVRFDHNTSPFETGWALETVTAHAITLNEYPGASYAPLRAAAAEARGVPVDHVAVGAGVDELLLLAGRAFLGPARRAASVSPTYPLYRISTLQAGADFTEVPALAPDLAYPIDAMLGAARNADLVWVCVPDNPTGARLDDEVVASLLGSTRGIVVLDAAYAEFTGDDWSAWVQRHDNLLVLHTLSKGYGVGGIRVGYGLASPDLVDAIDAVRPPGSISTISEAVAIQALAGTDRMRRRVDAINTERTRLGARLAELGARPHASVTNFLLCDVGPRARVIGESLMAEGLVLRMYPDDGPLARHLRITVRSPDENARLLEALEAHL